MRRASSDGLNSQFLVAPSSWSLIVETPRNRIKLSARLLPLLSHYGRGHEMRVSAPGADRPVRLATIERVSPPAFAPAGVFNRCSAALIGQFF